MALQMPPERRWRETENAQVTAPRGQAGETTFDEFRNRICSIVKPLMAWGNVDHRT